MTEQWDKRMVEFLRRTGEEIKSETQRLVTEVRDPAKQQKVKDALKEFGVWAKKTAEDATEMVETAIRKAESAWTKPGAPPSSSSRGTADSSAPASKDEDTQPHVAEASPAPKRPAKKTVGRKAGGGASGGAAKKPKAGAKTLGRKKS